MKGGDAAEILHAALRFHATAHVHAPGADRGDRLAHVVGRQSAGQHQLAAPGASSAARCQSASAPWPLTAASNSTGSSRASRGVQQPASPGTRAAGRSAPATSSPAKSPASVCSQSGSNSLGHRLPLRCRRVAHHGHADHDGRQALRTAARARFGVTRRGDSANTKPMASAPASTAAAHGAGASTARRSSRRPSWAASAADSNAEARPAASSSPASRPGSLARISAVPTSATS